MRVLVLAGGEPEAGRIAGALRQVWCDVDVRQEDEWEEPDWENGAAETLQRDYDAVILGSGLTGETGPEFLGRLRENRCRLPLVMVTRGGAAERTLALEQGADYCLSAPFDEEELLAALKAVLRRNGGFVPERLKYGDLVLDQVNFILSGPGGSLQLGKREFDVMQTLMLNRDMTVSKSLLLSRAWGDHPEAVDNNAEVYISFLRKKLRLLRAGVSIRTIRNLGYRLQTDPPEREGPDAP